MKRLYSLAFGLIFLISGFSQVRFTEVNTTTNDITLTNMSSVTVDVSSWFFCSSFGYSLLNMTTVVSGSLNLVPGATVTVNWSGGGMNSAMSDLCLFMDNSFTSSTSMQDFTQWGSGGNGRENVAVAKGIWTAGEFIDTPAPYTFNGGATDYGLSFWLPVVTVAGPCQDLFFSEYIEGSSSNKAFEIYNPTSSDVDLTDYVVYRANNGSLTPTDSIFPQGMIAAGDVFVVANPSANADIMAEMDTLHTLTFYNGDDAVWIQKISTGEMLDVIGEIGVDPGSGWPVGTGATNNFTLVRNLNIQEGNTDWSVGATEWDVYPIDDISFLGSHEMLPCGTIAPCSELFFSEIIEGSSNNKAIEVYNPTGADVDLTNYQILRFNNGGTSPSGTFNFPTGVMLADGDVWVSANPSADAALLAVADEDTSSVTFFNGDDAMVLMNTLTGDTLDIIGVVGVDPGSGWPVGTGATNNNTLVRMASVQSGTTDWSASATQWDVFNIDDFTHAGSHTMNPCGASSSFIGFAAAVLSVEENAGTLSIGVGLTNSDGTPVDVTVSLGTGGTATDVSDFTHSLPATLSYTGALDEVMTFDVAIVDDADVEGEETIQLVLSMATGGAELTTDTLTITISASDMEIPTYPIGDINNVDVDGVADSLAVECKIIGTVYGIDLQGGAAIQFTMHDGTGGIGIFSSDALGYTVTEGDEIRLIGSISQFNGLTQMNPDSIVFLSAGNPLNTPTVITVQDESTESELVTIECVTLDDPSQWSPGGSGFNVDVSNANGSYVIRVDSDVADVAALPAPTGVFTVTGIGGQFDSSSPFDSGYQLLPRYVADINENDANCVSAPVNDECTDAIDISNLFVIGSVETSEIFTNQDAGVGATDPTTGFECYGEPDGGGSAPSLENNVWFTFNIDNCQSPMIIDLVTTDCNGTVTDYIDNGDTQMSLYSGDCGALVPVACNEDSPDVVANNWFAGLNDISLIPNTDYSLMIDGYSASGVNSDGEFCIQVEFGCLDGLEEIAGIQVKAYPNPGNGALTVETAASVQRIQIFNALGQEVNFSSAQVQGKVNIDMLGNEAGIYQVLVQTAQGNAALQYVLTK